MQNQQPSPRPVSPPSPPPAATPPPSSGGLSKQWVIIIIVIIVAIATGLGGFLYWYYNVRTVPTVDPVVTTDSSGGVTSTTKTQPSVTPATTTTPTPTTTPDEGNLDHDGDTYTPNEGDCDDYNGAIGPGVWDDCNGIDDDCDGAIDEDCMQQTGSFDPASFDYSPYFIYSDEYMDDWVTLDADFDGDDEVLAVTYSPSANEYHAFIIDWDAAFGVYMMDYETTFVPPFAGVTTNDWNGDGWADFVIAFEANSSNGYAVIYDSYLDQYEEYYSDL